MRTTALTLAAALLAAHLHGQDGLNKHFGIGGQVGQIQRDFGIGLHVTSPYFANQKMAVRLRGNVAWNQHATGELGTTWTPYSNLSFGFLQAVGEMGDFVRVYGEGGAIFLFPAQEFSSNAVQFGGYGLFGFEFHFDAHMNYFLEAGGVGTGARADEVTGEPIYSNGFLMNVGVRVQF